MLPGNHAVPYSLFTFPVSYLIVSYILPDTQNSKTFFPLLLADDNLNSYLTDQKRTFMNSQMSTYLKASVSLHFIFPSVN